MTPAPGAGGEAKRKKRRRRRPSSAKPATTASTLDSAAQATTGDAATPATQPQPPKPGQGRSAKSGKPNRGNRSNKDQKRPPYAKRVDEVSAGGLVIDESGKNGLLIGRRDLKDPTKERLLWSLPKGHIEAGETPEMAAIREVAEETGIHSEISRSLGVIDFWFMAGGNRIHKTVHHYLFKEVGGTLQPQIEEVDEVGWFPLEDIVSMLAYPDEKKLIAKSGELTI
jgi:ADP-ribose pyrophosphatase YjhB (NUDIX family)